MYKLETYSYSHNDVPPVSDRMSSDFNSEHDVSSPVIVNEQYTSIPQSNNNIDNNRTDQYGPIS